MAAIKARFPDGIDVAYESVCGPLRDAVWENMAVFGRLICIGSVADNYQKEGAAMAHKIASNSTMPKSLTCVGFFLPNLYDDPRLPRTLEEILRCIQAGEISVRLDPHSASFKGLEGVFEAQRYIRTGRNVGKVYVSF